MILCKDIDNQVDQLFRKGVPTRESVTELINEILAGFRSGNFGGRKMIKEWSPAAAKLFDGTRETNERHRRIGLCFCIETLEAIAEDETVGRQYRERCRQRANRVRNLRRKGILDSIIC